MKWLNWLSIRPTIKLLRSILVLVFSGLIIGLMRIWLNEAFLIGGLSTLWFSALMITISITIYDIFNRAKDSYITIKRHLPKSFSHNTRYKINVDIQNHSQRELSIIFSESLPSQVHDKFSPINFDLPAKSIKTIEYPIKLEQRGQAIFESAWLQVSSKLGLWHTNMRIGDREIVKVLPNFNAITHSFSLGIEKAMRHIGANIMNRSGEGMDFKQLREFREGDTLKQIDWKATARMNEPISREYQEEKDQNIIFLLDCSRRMRAKEKNLSYFDCALQALLICSYIALDKGDAVGVLNFSGQPGWMPPIKGKTHINSLINHLYGLHTSTQNTDYINAAEDLLTRHRKRSLVILLTNVQSEDTEDLQSAISLLKRNHIVIVATIQENIISNAEKRKLKNEDDILLYAGIKQFEQDRKLLLRYLSNKGIPVIDATYQTLHQQLVNEYLKLKRTGRI